MGKWIQYKYKWTKQRNVAQHKLESVENLGVDLKDAMKKLVVTITSLAGPTPLSIITSLGLNAWPIRLQ